MTTNAGIGMSHHHNPNVAGHEAAEQALKNASISKLDFVFMFATVGYDQRSVLQAVREATGVHPSLVARQRAPSAATRQTNRTSPRSSWSSLLRSCGGPTA